MWYSIALLCMIVVPNTHAREQKEDDKETVQTEETGKQRRVNKEDVKGVQNKKVLAAYTPYRVATPRMSE